MGRVIGTSDTAVPGEYLMVDASSGAATVTLPPAAIGGTITVEKIDASGNAVTISGDISGEPSVQLMARGDSVALRGGGPGYRCSYRPAVALSGPGGWDSSPFQVPQWVQPSNITTTLQSGHGWTNNAGSTLTTDTSDFVLGSQSVVITTGGAGAQANLSKTGMTSFDATGKAVRIRFKVVDLTNVAEFGIFLGSSSFAAFYKWSIWTAGSSRFAQSGEWVTMTLSFHDATSSGSPNRAALTDARFYIIDNNTGAQVQVKWQSMELIPDGSATWPNGVVSFTFDDTYGAQWTGAKKTLDSYGYPGTAFLIGDYVDTVGRLTTTQIKSMQDVSGWEIAAHASTGVNHTASYTGLSGVQLEADIRSQRAWLMSRGLRAADGMAYPLGQFGRTADNLSTLDIVRAHFGYARTTSSRMKETLPPADRYRLRAISAITGLVTAGAYAVTNLTTATTGDIDKCKANKSWLILVFHNITAGAATSTTEIQQSDFDTIVAAVNAAGIPVKTISEVLRTTP